MDRPTTSSGRPGTNSAKRGARSVSLTAVASKFKTPMYVSDKAMPEETETIRAIEATLRIPIFDNRAEEVVVQDNLESDGLCTDKAFPPNDLSIFPRPDERPPDIDVVFNWRRVSGTVYLPLSKTIKILQGMLFDQWFLGALGAVACKRDLLLDLIVSDDHAAQGMYTFQFYKHGSWQQVSVDNYLPTVAGEDRLAFACSGNAGELWPSLLEKAYAKVHGGYFALHGGSVRCALVDLTGGVAFKVDLRQEDTLQDAKEGDLWDELADWLASGSVVAAQHRYKALDDPYAEEGESTAGQPELSGLLPNHVYGVTESLSVGSARLLKLYCPWVAGHWTGAWAPGSEKWSTPAAAAARASMESVPQDPATFWIAYEDFISNMNLVYRARIFPPAWHTLTLHCGWSGPSAGGPYLVGGHMSSTWCCNPQFRLTVRRSAEVVVALGQQDPQVFNQGHLKRQQRRRSIGLNVLRVPLNVLGRRWEMRPSDTVAEAVLTQQREAVITFRMDPDYAYVLVPYTARAGEDGAFVLRVFCSTAIEVEQLPSPLSLVIGGYWSGPLAGGPRSASTWGSNPQYMISVGSRTPIVISLTRLDMKHALMRPSFREEDCVGFVLVRPDAAPAEGLKHKAAVRHASEVVSESEFDTMDEAVGLVTLEPDCPCVLVPSLAAPGIEAPFELRIMSGVPLELVPLPEVRCVALRGEWREDSSGGCDIHPSWVKNPRFLLGIAASSAHIRIALSRLDRPRTPRPSIDDMLGFYILRAPPGAGSVNSSSVMLESQDMKRLVVSETTFVPMAEVSKEVDLSGSVADDGKLYFLIVPCTYSPGRMGRFMVSAASNEELTLAAL